MIYRRDPSLPHAAHPDLFRDRCSQCHEDALIKVTVRTEHCMKGRCTWCGAPQRRTSRMHYSAIAGVANLPTRPAPPGRDAAIVAALLEEGITIRATAERFGVSRTLVSTVLSKHRKQNGHVPQPYAVKRAAARDIGDYFVACHYEAGWSAARVCRELAITHQRLSAIRLKMGQRPGQRDRLRRHAELTAEMQRLHLKGVSQREIGIRLGVSTSTVSARLRALAAQMERLAS